MVACGGDIQMPVPGSGWIGHRLGRDRFNDDLCRFRSKSEQPLMCGEECRAHCRSIGFRDRQGSVRSFHLQPPFAPDGDRAGGDALRDEALACFGVELVEGCHDRVVTVLERTFDGCFAGFSQFGETDTERRQQARHRVKQDGFHAKALGDLAAMLATRTAKGRQGVLRRVHALTGGDVLDRLRHVLDGDF